MSKTRYHKQIKVKMPNSSQEPPSSFKSLNKDLEDMYDLFTFKIKIESRTQNTGISKTSDNIHINIKMSNPSQEPPAFSKVMIMGQSKTSEHIQI